MVYIDTSVLIAALSHEVFTEHAQTWLAAQDASHFVISDWTIAEMSSALALKLRAGKITLDQRANALTIFNRMMTESFVVLAVTGRHFRTAARFTDRHELGLRAGDALHLAAASSNGAVVTTLDRRLADAGPLLGVPTHFLARSALR